MAASPAGGTTAALAVAHGSYNKYGMKYVSSSSSGGGSAAARSDMVYPMLRAQRYRYRWPRSRSASQRRLERTKARHLKVRNEPCDLRLDWTPTSRALEVTLRLPYASLSDLLLS